MTGAREFASMLCIAAVSCCALRLLIPQGALDPVLRMILSAFFLLCLLSPLRRLPSFALPQGALEEGAAPYRAGLDESYSALVEEAVEKNIGKLVEARLQKIGAEGTNIRINVNTNEEGSIDISGIELTLSPESAGLAAQVKESIEKDMELPCAVRISPEV